MSIYQRIKELCAQKNISVRQLEIKLGFSNGTIRKWNNSAPTERLSMVAKYFNVTVDYLILGHVDNKPMNVAEPEHIDVDEIVNNMGLLTSRKYALSDEDRAAISSMVKGYLESKEGQGRLRKYGKYNSDGSRKEE